MKLSIGDMVYYEGHLALGILVNYYYASGTKVWKYLLRSPKRSDLSYHLTSFFEAEECKIVNSIKSGHLQYYSAKNEKTN